MNNDNPILNNPYEEPERHYATDYEGALDYKDIRKGRRIFTPDPTTIPVRQDSQKSMYEINDFSYEYSQFLVNLIRSEVGEWRKNKYPKTTRVTKELLSFWFMDPNRDYIHKLFFAQREAVETAIWLNEVASKSDAGQNILNKLKTAQEEASDIKEEQLPRIAFKMATGTGKTVVMCCLILYHFFNRQEYRNDKRFADYFLVIAPSITIKGRLGVLFIDKGSENREDYYAVRDLVPKNLEHIVDNLNSRLIVTNYHSLKPKNLQGNKVSPFDGKIGVDGKTTRSEEHPSQLVKRVLGNFKQKSRLLIFNDEAHHCYKPKLKTKTTDTEANENAKAAVWFKGLLEISKRFNIQQLYDLSATPYYLKGSGYEAYSLFPWVVSDFGLVESIESGLVKIPFIPESDNTHALEMPVLRNLYENVKDRLPRKGLKKEKSEASKSGSKIIEEPPNLPLEVKMALDQFFDNYIEYREGIRNKQEEKRNLYSSPPVFIIVCNNTSVSKEVYKFIAGYEEKDENGNVIRVEEGYRQLFSNYDSNDKPKKKPPTLLIDSASLENSDQINEEFKEIFKTEIEEFKRNYSQLYGQSATDRIKDADILREVVNTVGKDGKLGSHIQCVVSVSMLTEGWDANNVTHIMGLRAFGSQLLCEQVAGRALRRMNYVLQTYRRDNGMLIPEKDRDRYKKENIIEKFPPEYARIIGVPFTMFKGGITPPPKPVDYKHIKAIPDREKDYEIKFPNLIGYRIEDLGEDIDYDFSDLKNYELNIYEYPIENKLVSAFSPKEEKMSVESVLKRRDQELIFLLTKYLIENYYSDSDGNPKFQLFGKLKEVVEVWYNTKVTLLNSDDPGYKRLLFFEKPSKVCNHIRKGINTHRNTEEYIHPIFNYYNKSGSTKYVNRKTTKEVIPTTKSHINYVVMDSSWEGIASKTFEELGNVVKYVKNHFLEFTIPYIKGDEEKLYLPDFIANIRNKQGEDLNLIIEISGMSKDKMEKIWFVENRWIPAINSVQKKYGKWDFIEIDDIRDIKNKLINKINLM